MMTDPNRGDFAFLHISDHLEERKEGYWVAAGQANEISYPELHHDALLSEQETSFWYEHRKKCLALILEKFKTPELLDVGGSNGLLAKYLSSLTNVSILEPHAAGIKNAMALGIKPVVHADFRVAGFQKNSIPAVGLFDVLEHIEDDKAFLKEIERTLEPGGRLYLTVPALQSLWSDFDLSVGHFRRYNRKQIEELMQSVGLKVEYFTYMFSPLPIPIWFKRVLTRKKETTKATQSHYKENGLVGRVLKWLLAPEFYMIKRQKSIAWGSSCLCVAKKISSTE